MTPPTLETIRAALACIPADLPRDEWARVAMALKSELGGAGFELFDAWSARAEGYKSKDARDTWRSVKAGGKVGIGTLFRLAGLHGYKPSDTAPAPKPTPAEVRASVLAKAKRIARDLADRETRQRDAAAEAAEQWAQASDEGQSPYLVRKGVQGHGVRFAAGGALLVPMRDTAGELWNVQAIKPERPADGGPDKLFLRGGRKSGLLHWFGSPEGAPVLLVGEGYATCASVHEATGRPVAFDAGNLAHVAKAIGKAYSAALIVLCADNDHETEAKTGRNPGHEKATEAARAVRGAVVWPEGLPAGASDFNDLAAHAGPGAVRERIEAAIAQGPQGARKRPSVPKPSGEPNDAPAGPPEAGPMPWDRFHSDDTGVWFTEHDAEGRTKAPQWVCSPLKVTARTRDADESSWGYLLEFTCPLGKPRQWAMPARMLASDGAEYRAILLGLGLRIASGTKARNLLVLLC